MMGTRWAHNPCYFVHHLLSLSFLQRSGYPTISRLFSTSFTSLDVAAMAELNNSVLYQVSEPSISQCGCGGETLPRSGLQTAGLVAQIWSHFTILRLLVALIVLSNLKNVPLIWHVSKYLTAISITYSDENVATDCQCLQILSPDSET